MRLHLKNGAYYYVFRNKWTFLSREYAEALHLYAGLIAPNTGKLPPIIDRWLAGKTLATKTRSAYSVVANKLKVAFEEFRPEDVKPSHLYQLIAAKKITTGMAGHYRSVMVGVMQLCVEEGLIDVNPINEVKHYTSRSRDRYLTDEEYLSIHTKATPTLRAIMDVCYLTGQRIGDVLSIRYSDLTEDGIVFEQQKTKTRLCVEWSPDLRLIVANAKALHQSVKGLTLFHTRQGKPFSYNTVRTLWDRAVRYSAIEDAHMHDIRAKAATDAKKQGINSQALLGHKSEAVHLRYQRNKETPLVSPVRMIVSK